MTESCSLVSSWAGTCNGSFPYKISQEQCAVFLVTLCPSNRQEHLQLSTLEQQCCLKSHENQIPYYPKKLDCSVTYEPCNVGVELLLPMTVAKRPKDLLFFLKEKVVKGKNSGGSWLDESHLCSSHS